MPPLGNAYQPSVIPDPPVGGGYNATFVVGSTTAGFDIKRDGYASTVAANVNVRPIPWSQTYSVVIQRGGLKPHARSYQAVVYSEADFITLATLVNLPGGVLTTPREPSGVAANLDSFSRGQSMDFTNYTGLTEVNLAFTILA